MLVLSRRLNEKLLLPDIQAAIQVVSIKHGVVRLGIDAPPEVAVVRAELKPRPGRVSVPVEAPDAANPSVPHLVQKRLELVRSGLALLRRELARGQCADASLTLEKVDEDLRLLQGRLEQETGRALPPTAAPRGSRKALLVEDNANERKLLATFLRTTGMEVVTAGDGADALDYLHQGGRPDVVLLDMGLPRCDGATMVRAVRRDPALSGLKIFAVSAHSPEEYDLARGPGGVDRWFHKPIDPVDLVRDVHRELDAVPTLA